MNKSESKYFNTALRMDEALIELLEKKDLEYITVKEICQQAGVNRSTFYLHYETISDLLRETMEMVNQRFLSYFSLRGEDFAEGVGTMRYRIWCLSPGSTCCPTCVLSRITKRCTGQPFGTRAACRCKNGMGT